MQYLLDTNICVFFLRGKFNLDQAIKEKGRENCFISEITVLELRYGAENSDDPVKSHKSVDDFLNGLSIISPRRRNEAWAFSAEPSCAKDELKDPAFNS